jgi:hypothetical protein
MGKKNRRSSAKPAKPARRSAVAGSGAGADAAELVESSVDELWAAIAAGDVFTAEVQASVYASMALMADIFGNDLGVPAEEFPGLLIDSVIRDRFTPESAAFCRLLMTFGLPALKAEASTVLEEHTDDGIYPPDWVTDAGRPVPRRAWRSYSDFGDDEFVIVTFSYGDEEHAILVGLDLAVLPTVAVLSAAPEPDKLIKVIRERDEPSERFEEITLTEARRRLEEPLASADEGLDPDVSNPSYMFLPLVRSRIRRLPAGSHDAPVTYTAADRAAAVDEFLRSPLAASAGDADAARFWAQVLTGYSGRVPGEPPAHVGPGKLRATLLRHVACTFTLTDAQRASLRPAVTAWSRWAAGRQELSEEATATMLEHLQQAFDDFESAHDDPHNVTHRSYLSDLGVASDVDVAWLADCRARREFAVPFPADREPGHGALDLGDQEHRIVISMSEFGRCDPGPVPRDEWPQAVNRVVEELWHDDPPVTWQAAKRLRAKRLSRHDIVHALAAGHPSA